MSGTNIEDLIDPNVIEEEGEKIAVNIRCLLDAIDSLLREVRIQLERYKR